MLLRSSGGRLVIEMTHERREERRVARGGASRSRAHGRRAREVLCSPAQLSPPLSLRGSAYSPCRHSAIWSSRSFSRMPEARASGVRDGLQRHVTWGDCPLCGARQRRLGPGPSLRFASLGMRRGEPAAALLKSSKNTCVYRCAVLIILSARTPDKAARRPFLGLAFSTFPPLCQCLSRGGGARSARPLSVCDAVDQRRCVSAKRNRVSV